MATQPQAPQAPPLNDPFGNMQTKALEAVSAYAQTNQRVLGELVNLSSAAMTETLRVYSELESAAIEAARTAPLPPAPPAMFENLVRDPVAGYRQGILAAGEAPQRLFKLFDSQWQIIGQGAQRFQASAERSGKEIQEAITSYFNRLGEIYGRS
jgi:hypothetical protein